MSMREAFDIYFNKMNDVWKKEMGSYPQYPYNERIQPNMSKKLFIPNSINNGYIQWQPKLQDALICFGNLEKELGFVINTEIKEYFSTYWFLRMNGKIDEMFFYMYSIFPDSDILTIVKKSIERGKYHYNQDGIYFVIGFANINYDDSYSICINNKTGEVTCVQFQDKISIKVADSIEELIKNMNGVL